jgi:hypothetical protein
VILNQRSRIIVPQQQFAEDVVSLQIIQDVFVTSNAVVHLCDQNPAYSQIGDTPAIADGIDLVDHDCGIEIGDF